MPRKKILERRKARYEKKRAELLKRSEESEDVKEVRAINKQLQDIADELKDITDELEAIADEESGSNSDGGDGDGDGSQDGDNSQTEEGRSAATSATLETRNSNIVASYGQNVPTERRESQNLLESMEYRQAFAKYVQTGDATNLDALQSRAASDGMVITSDIGKVIPKTIMDELITGLKVYGGLYNRVRKMNIKGGVEVPIEDLVPTVRWIGEKEVSSNQSAPEIKTSVSFGYYIAEARIAQSLLASITSLPVLESEIARSLAEAFLREFDRIIVAGTGSGQPTGILNDERVKAENKLPFTDAETADWAEWRKKLFAKVPLAYRGQGVLVMTSATWESQIMTLKDNNNRPLYSETYDPVSGEQICRFAGREVQLVEPDILKDFEAAEDGDAFAIYFKPTDYAINSNLEVGFKRYMDEDNNKWVNKGLTIVDGKLLDVNSVFVLKRSIPKG